MSNVVLRWILSATLIQQLQQPIFQRLYIAPFANDVVLMKHMTEEVTVVQREMDLRAYICMAGSGSITSRSAAGR